MSSQDVDALTHKERLLRQGMKLFYAQGFHGGAALAIAPDGATLAIHCGVWHETILYDLKAQPPRERVRLSGGFDGGLIGVVAWDSAKSGLACF